MAEEQEQYVALEGSAIALPEDENGIVTYQLTNDVNQAGIYRLVNALPASSLTLGFDMSIEDHDGESRFVIELADDYKAFRIAHTISPSTVTTVIDMDWKTYEGEEKHYDIHTSTFEGALLPLVDGIWELSVINGFMSLSIDETLIIDNLDVEPYPISLDSGVVVVRAITTDTPIVQTIHDVFLEPVIVFDNHVYFSKSLLAEKYENLTWDDLGSNAQFSNVEVAENVIIDGSLTAASINALTYENLPPTNWDNITDKPEIVLCEGDMKVHVLVGCIMPAIGRKINEFLLDLTFDNTIMGQTVSRDDYIELANQLGIPKSRPTFVVPALTTEWTNVTSKPTNFQADWNSTVINKPSEPFSATDFWNNCPVGVIMIWAQTTLPSAKWAWCDGLNGTVDLTGRAPIGATKYSNFANPASPDYQRWFNNPGDKIGSGSTYLSDVQIPTHRLYFTDTHTHSYDYRYGSGSTYVWHENSSTKIAPAGGGGATGSSTSGAAINLATVSGYTNGTVYRTSDNSALTTSAELPVPVTLYQPSTYVLFIQKIVA